jgi:hypothetical protein
VGRREDNENKHIYKGSSDTSEAKIYPHARRKIVPVKHYWRNLSKDAVQWHTNYVSCALPMLVPHLAA